MASSKNPQSTFSTTSFDPGSFWHRRRSIVQTQTLPVQRRQLKESGRYDAFKLGWHPTYSDEVENWPIPNGCFWDSDVGKWIEAVCYFLQHNADASGPSTRALDDLESSVHELVDQIRKAQQPDGYLNIHYTVVEPDKRWTYLSDTHELYNAGHLIEAALAHHSYFGTRELLDPILRYVDLIASVFGRDTGQIAGYDGHPEIELALVRLYRLTKDAKHLQLARFFLQERGNPTGVEGRHFWDVQADKRGESPYTRPAYWPKPKSYWVNQAHLPILEMPTIEGHSVRAMYLLTGLVDLLLCDASMRPDYWPVVQRLWGDLVQKKMYVTGGIGSNPQYEGFDIAYFLPQSADEGGCYAETCAAIGVIMLAERLLQLDRNGEYGDIMELCLYNAVLTGMSMDGTQFAYENHLASSDGHPSQRQDWFTVSCCPPNVARLIGSLGGYIWSRDEAGSSAADLKENRKLTVNIHLYTSASRTFDIAGESPVHVKLTQQTDWPWGPGHVDFCVNSDNADVATELHLRIPAWAHDQWEIKPALECPQIDRGYLHLPAAWLAQNPRFRLTIPLQPRLIRPHPFTNQNTVSIARGPIVYCAEDVDNPWATQHFKTVYLDPAATLHESRHADLPSGEAYTRISAIAAARILDISHELAPSTVVAKDEALLRFEPQRRDVHFLPYFARANRGGKGQMRVGFKELHC